MLSFLIYEGKVALALAVFYMFYRLLLRKETFHRLNRMVLVGTAVLSFLLPLCIITIHKPMEFDTEMMAPTVEMMPGASPAVGKAVPWWPVALTVLFWAGAVFVLARVAFSILSILRIVRRGEVAGEEEGCRIVVTDRDIDPFSWMKYIVLSRKDWEGDPAPILAHEKAHVGFGHSVELLVVDILSAFQWFNPAVWMLRADLQELHEYEADDAVLRAGTDIRAYQYLLIRKAVGKSGYSVANSFNHSILKNRITMMSKSKSPLSRGLRVLWLLPLVCLGIGLQAQTVYDPSHKGNEKSGNTVIIGPDDATPLFILRQAWGEEKEITKAEFDEIEQHRIRSVQVLKDSAALEKYGERGANGVIVITMKLPQELEEIVVVSDLGKADEAFPFYLVEPETMPLFQGEDRMAFSRWLNERIYRPKGCEHVGSMKVEFVVGTDGTVKDVKVTESVCEALDALVVSLIGQSPKWEPATSGGYPVEQCLTIPISFRIR